MIVKKSTLVFSLVLFLKLKMMDKFDTMKGRKSGGGGGEKRVEFNKAKKKRGGQ